MLPLDVFPEVLRKIASAMPTWPHHLRASQDVRFVLGFYACRQDLACGLLIGRFGRLQDGGEEGQCSGRLRSIRRSSSSISRRIWLEMEYRGAFIAHVRHDRERRHGGHLLDPLFHQVSCGTGLGEERYHHALGRQPWDTASDMESSGTLWAWQPPFKAATWTSTWCIRRTSCFTPYAAGSTAPRWGTSSLGRWYTVILVKPSFVSTCVFLISGVLVAAIFVGFSVLAGSLAFFIGTRRASPVR